ncbi:MAG: hypothetical protein R2882_11850 [Gemmatimonadales bacterium]
MTSGSSILVANGRDQEIVEFDPDGASGRRTGRAGDGPCEFRNLSAIAVMPGGLIAARDSHIGQLRICPVGGGPSRTLLLPGRTFDGLWARGDTLFVVATTSDSVLALRVVFQPSGAETIDTLTVSPPSEWRAALDGAARSTLKAMVPDGSVLIAATDTFFAIAKAGPGRTPARRFIRDDRPPLVLSADEVAERQAELENTLRRTGRPVPAGGIGSPPGPVTRPWFAGGRHLAVDSLGRVWALPNSTASRPPALELYSAEGSLTARFAVPASTRGLRLDGPTITLYGAGEDDTGWVKVYPLPGGGEPHG